MTSSVSVVATVKDEADSIEGFVESLLRQTRPPDEIVVVDGGSSDGTAGVLSRSSAADSRLRIHTAPGSSIAEGRNVAIRLAAGPIIAVADAGTVLRPDWLEKLAEPFEHDAALAVSGGFFLPGGKSRFERCLATVITPQLQEIDAAEFLPSSRSIAFRKSWWSLVGGYPEWLRHCEDLVFDLDLRSAGATFAFAPEALVSWHARSSLRAFARQYFNYARGDGHADLWPRRHAARYAAYALGLYLAGVRHDPAGLGLLTALTAVYMKKFYLRLYRLPPSRSARGRTLCALLVPPIVVTGDVAKMVGYPIGRFERWRAGDLARRTGEAPL